MSTGSFFTQREIHAKRAPERGHWESEAICSNADPSLFEFNEADPEGSASLIETGIDTYCLFCPVSDECLTNATDEDKTWTVRGGQKPTLLTLGPIGGEEVDGFKRGDGGRFITTEVEKRFEEYVCKREHSRERARITFRKNGKPVIICLDCKKVYESKRSGARLAAYNKKRRDERAALRAAREEKS
jgi:hypothetical protein